MVPGETGLSGLRSRRIATGLWLGLTTCTLALIPVLAPSFSLAQAQLPGVERFAAEDPDARMLLEANELIYDFDNDIVTAEGNVEIYYRGHTVEADRVIYDQNTRRVFARDNVRITEPDGNVIFADTIELTDDFREGFLEQLLLVTQEDARFAAVSAERLEDNLTVFTQGIYTACEPCEANPSRPPVWQIKAARIIHDQQEQVVYYENARFELLGIPIAYMPFFSHPDPTVKRQSGFLAPELGFDSGLGTNLKVPYYFALAPNYDLTVAATGFSKQGALGEFEWRHRLKRGAYIVEGAGIKQLKQEEFAPRSPGDRELRGFIRTAGEFEINDFWRWGFDGRLTSDPTFQRRYNFTNDTEYRNEVYLTGQSARNWADARIINYKSMTVTSRTGRFVNEDPYLPVIHPVIDYNYIFDQPVLGGRLGIDVNFLSLSRRQAEFQNRMPFSAAADPCRNAGTLADLAVDPDLSLVDECELRGVPGTVNRLVSQARWEATMVDSLGQIFTPFASVRGDVYAMDIDDPYLELTGGQSIVGSYLPTGESTIVRGMPAVGMEYRWPFLFATSWGYQIIEPTAQIIARPNEQKAPRLPNEDAKSLVFDDTTLFARDKFSGYDRVEGGTRANVGIRYNMQMLSGISAGAMFGQSYHLGGENPFPLGSGLENNRSDYVAGAYVSPTENLEISSRLRFDERNFSVRRHDLEARGALGPLEARLTYSDISAEPAAGINFDRRELLGAATLRLDENWRTFGAARIELDGPGTGTQWISNSFGFGYIDDCIALAIAYERRYVRDGDIEPDQRITVRFNLRTLTEGETAATLGDSSSIF
jgi:LPS-assembly protein